MSRDHMSSQPGIEDCIDAVGDTVKKYKTAKRNLKKKKACNGRVRTACTANSIFSNIWLDESHHSKRKHRKSPFSDTVIPRTPFNVIGTEHKPKPISVKIDLTAATSPPMKKPLSHLKVKRIQTKADLSAIKEQLVGMLIEGNRNALKVEEYSILGRIWEARNNI